MNTLIPPSIYEDRNAMSAEIPAPISKSPCKTLVVLAFLAVYLAWGATYLGIRFAIETIPPLSMAGIRFVVSGIALFSALKLCDREGFRFGSLLEWKDAAITGILLLVFGNGCLTWAEQYVSSGVASLFFAISPLWMVIFDWLHPKGKKPSPTIIAALVIGLAGIWILRDPDIALFHASNLNFGYLALLVTGLSWGAGAIYSRHVHTEGTPLLPIARQLLVAGFILLLVGNLHGDYHHYSPSTISLRSWLGLGYLITFGTLIGYTAYVWLMKVSTPAKVGTTAYVNPIIAVLLGWAFGDEPLTLRIAISSALIVLSVIVVLRKPRES